MSNSERTRAGAPFHTDIELDSEFRGGGAPGSWSSSPTRGGTLRWGDFVGSHASPTRGGTLRGVDAFHELRWNEPREGGGPPRSDADAPAVDPLVESMRTPTELLTFLSDALAGDAPAPDEVDAHPDEPSASR